MPQQRVGRLVALGQRQAREPPVAPARQQDDARRVVGQVSGVELRQLAVGGVGQGEEPGEIGVPGAGAGQQREPRAVGEGHLAARDGSKAQAVGELRELQRAAEVGVGQGQGGVSVLLGLGQQFVGMRRPHPEGVEALGVQLDVAGCHQATCRYQRSSCRSRNSVTGRPSPASIR